MVSAEVSFLSVRQNGIQDITAHLLSETCHDVLIERTLQQLNREFLPYSSANHEDWAQVDIAIRDFWNFHQRPFFDISVFNPFSSSYSKASLWSCHRKNEAEKRRRHEERIISVEHRTFTPLVFTTAGGMGPAACT